MPAYSGRSTLQAGQRNSLHLASTIVNKTKLSINNGHLRGRLAPLKLISKIYWSSFQDVQQEEQHLYRQLEEISTLK